MKTIYYILMIFIVWMVFIGLLSMVNSIEQSVFMLGYIVGALMLFISIKRTTDNGNNIKDVERIRRTLRGDYSE